MSLKKTYLSTSQLPHFLANHPRFRDLQISIIYKSDIEKASRMDAETFIPEYVEIEKKLKKNNGIYLKEIVGKYTNGAEVRNFTKSGIPYIRVSNTSNAFFVNFNNVKYISKKDFEKKKKNYSLKQNDLLLNRSGTLGFCQIINFEDSLFSSHNIRLSNIKINSYFLCSFLNCKYGKLQIKRYSNGAVVPEINHLGLNLILIPLLPQSFQLQIEALVKSAHQKQTQSKKLYCEAEQILLEELGLVGYQPKHQLFFEVTKKEVEDAHRFDAEYFQPKYKEIIKFIENYKSGFCEIKEIAELKNGSFISETEYTNKSKRAYIRIKELSLDNILEKEQMIFINDNFKKKNETQVKKNDFVIATIGATIGKTNLISKEFESSFPSNNTSRIRLKSKNEKFYFYEFLFRSFLFQKQIEREFTQTAQPKISNSQIKNIKIPLVAPAIQNQIAQKIEASHQLRKQSKDLLEKAKQQVEEEIEKSIKS